MKRQLRLPASEIQLAKTHGPAHVKMWAVLGACCLAFQLYLWLRWTLSGNFRRTPSGSDEIPTFMRVAAHAHEGVAILIAVAVFYTFVVRPWRLDRRLGLPGLLCLACLTMYWQNTAANWSAHTVVWNTAFFQRGSWYNFIPAWIAPRANRIPEPLLFLAPFYVFVFVLPALGIARCMRQAKKAWPDIGSTKLFLIAFGLSASIDFVLETFWLRLGVYSYAGAIPSLTLFSGHYYQFPTYEALLWGLSFTAMGFLAYSADDRGQTFVERGVERFRLSDSRRLAVRCLALAGFMNTVVFVYNAAWGVISLQPDVRWSADIVFNRSYLRDDLCGRGTGYACPGKDLPLARRDTGSHVDVDGELVVPPGAEGSRYR